MPTDQIKNKQLKIGFVGGGPNSGIGRTHLVASRMDNKFILCAGVFSKNFNKSINYGISLNLKKDRCYSNYNEMAKKESERLNGIDVVAIMTPPSSHQKIAEAFIERNIHVISDKPFAANLKQAKSLLKSINKNKKIVYALTHNYSAYPMVREAKKIVENEKLGKIEMINVEYVQDWGNGTLINHKNSKKILYWRAEKNIQGISSVLNEIGTHAYHLALYITGLKGKKIFADIKQVSTKVNCDDNAQVFINYENGAKGILWASTTAKGGIYGLRIRIFGTKGSIEWVQKDPNYLKFNPAKGAVKILEKDFNEAKYSSRFSRISYGHPEGFFDAFANIYSETATAILNKKNRKKNNKYLFPTAEEGYLTAKFVDTCKRSSSKKQWVKL